MPECRAGEIPFFRVGDADAACLLYADGDRPGRAAERT
jgi:hypothetical protein